MRTTLILAALILFVVSIAFIRFPAPAATENVATPLSSYEIVDTDEERERGLSDRSHVPPEYGMLFVFETEATPGFWMKDMLVSIDMVWLSSDGIIVGITENIAPETYPALFYPPSPVRYVLEVAAGEAARKGWKAGDRLPLPI